MADLNFLSQIRETEQKASDIVSQAAENARVLQDSTRQQAAELVRTARDEAAAARQARLAEVESSVDAILREAREQSAAEADTRSTAAAARLEKAAAAVAERIVSENVHR